MSGEVKVGVNDELRRKGVPRKRRGVIVLVAGLYLLLENSLDQIDQVIIDDELPGWGKEIKRLLLGLFRQKSPNFSKAKIDVRRIGESTQADRVAGLTRRKERKPYRKLTFIDLISVIKRIR